MNFKQLILLRALSTMDVSIIIVNWNTRKLLFDCLKSVYDTTSSLDNEIIVVDNGSHDGSGQAVQERFPQVRFIQNTDYFFNDVVYY